MPDRPVVLVVGASKGIGVAPAPAFAEVGYDVGVNYHDDTHGAAETVARCEAIGAIVMRADVADGAAVATMFERCVDTLGPVVGLVNNAGIIGGKSVLADPAADALAATFATNVFGTVHCLQEAVQRMRTDRGAAGGAIITMSSLAATPGSPG